MLRGPTGEKKNDANYVAALEACLSGVHFFLAMTANVFLHNEGWQCDKLFD